MLNVAIFGLRGTSLYSITESGLRDVVRLCNTSDWHFLARTDSLNDKKNSGFLGLRVHCIVVLWLRTTVRRSRCGRKVYGSLVCAGRLWTTLDSVEHKIYSNFIIDWIKYENPLWYKVPCHDYIKKANLSMVTSSPSFYPWGFGKHACPGRFLAANAFKSLLGYVVLNYDIEPLVEWPRGRWVANVSLPPMKAVIQVRRRKDAWKEVSDVRPWLCQLNLVLVIQSIESCGIFVVGFWCCRPPIPQWLGVRMSRHEYFQGLHDRLKA